MKRLWVYSLALMGILSLGACQQKPAAESAVPEPIAAPAPVVVSTAAANAAPAAVPAATAEKK
jgi:ABC-type Zn uptake system ZnuABC Zn-binding protein ZnuA